MEVFIIGRDGGRHSVFVTTNDIGQWNYMYNPSSLEAGTLSIGAKHPVSSEYTPTEQFVVSKIRCSTPSSQSPTLTGKIL